MELMIEHLLEQGIAAHKEGKLQAAEKLYRSILDVQPQHSDANHNLGILSMDAGKIEEAVSSLKIALEANPKQGQFWLSYLDALIQLGHFDNAKQILRQSRNIGLARDWIDRLEARMDEIGTSAPKVSVGTQPSQEQIDYLITLYFQGDLQQALVQGNILTGQFPNDPVIQNILSGIYSGLKNYEAATITYNKAIALKPDFAEAHHNRGIFLSNIGKYKEAIAIYNKAIALKPDFTEVHINLGNTLKLLGKHKEAIISYCKAVEFNPNNAEAYNNLGVAFNKLSKHDQAISCYNKAIELKPDFSGAYNNLGEVFRKLGRYEEAIVQFNIANNPTSKAKILECLYETQNYTKFNEELNLLIETDKKNIRIAAISAFIANQLKQEDPYPFCKNPIDFFHVSNLTNYVINVSEFIDGIILEAERENALWEPENTATVAGFQTRNNIFQAGRNCADLGKIIEKEINSYRSKFAPENCLFIKSWPIKHAITGWYVRLKKNGYQTAHIHQDGWISGVIYLKTVDFGNTIEGALEVSLYGYDLNVLDKNYPKEIYRPKIGDIVLFPSSLFHKTIPFTKDTERCVIAFDLIPLDH